MLAAIGYKTGVRVNCWGLNLDEIDQRLGIHDLILVDGVSYYTWDYGGFIVGSRTATSVDYTGNDVGRGIRVAPESLSGMAAPLPRRAATPTRIEYSDPEIVGFGHRIG